MRPSRVRVVGNSEAVFGKKPVHHKFPRPNRATAPTTVDQCPGRRCAFCRAAGSTPRYGWCISGGNEALGPPDRTKLGTCKSGLNRHSFRDQSAPHSQALLGRGAKTLIGIVCATEGSVPHLYTRTVSKDKKHCNA